MEEKLKKDFTRRLKKINPSITDPDSQLVINPIVDGLIKTWIKINK